jgi:hypothetical protein
MAKLLLLSSLSGPGQKERERTLSQSVSVYTFLTTQKTGNGKLLGFSSANMILRP